MLSRESEATILSFSASSLRTRIFVYFVSMHAFYGIACILSSIPENVCDEKMFDHVYIHFQSLLISSSLFEQSVTIYHALPDGIYFITSLEIFED